MFLSFWDQFDQVLVQMYLKVEVVGRFLVFLPNIEAVLTHIVSPQRF